MTETSFEPVIKPVLCNLATSGSEIDSKNPYSFPSCVFENNPVLDQDTIDLFSGTSPFVSEKHLSDQNSSPKPIISDENPFSFKNFMQSEYSRSIPVLPEEVQPGCILHKVFREDSAENITIPLESGSILATANSKLNSENISLLKRILLLETRNESLSIKLENLQRKDSEEARELEKVILDVEHKLDKANKRALDAEYRLDKLKTQYSRLQRDQNVCLREFYQEQTYSIGNKIRLASSEAEIMLNQLLTGVGNLRQLADLLESLHKLSEPIDSNNSCYSVP